MRANHTCIQQRQKSFLVMGNGDCFSLSDIQDSTLDNVDLVVLSACETGVGLTGKDEDGIEVLGIGYQFQRGGAKAAISSLWSINDDKPLSFTVKPEQVLSYSMTSGLKHSTA